MFAYLVSWAETTEHQVVIASDLVSASSAASKLRDGDAPSTLNLMGEIGNWEDVQTRVIQEAHDSIKRPAADSYAANA